MSNTWSGNCELMDKGIQAVVADPYVRGGGRYLSYTAGSMGNNRHEIIGGDYMQLLIFE